MPVIRNPFRRNATASGGGGFDSASEQTPAHLGAGRLPASEANLATDEVGRVHSSRAKSASAISIGRESRSLDEKNTYKLSVVNDSGVYLPPSPPDKKSFWRRNDHSPQLTALTAEEPFVISRESFESYRRSFDISARSPVLDPSPGRVSFDSRPLAPRSSLDVRSSTGIPPIIVKNVGVEPVEEDGFEDVKLNDDARPKKRSIFSRFGTDHSSSDSAAAVAPAPHAHGVRSLFGRKDIAQETVLESELKRIERREG